MAISRGKNSSLSEEDVDVGTERAGLVSESHLLKRARVRFEDSPIFHELDQSAATPEPSSPASSTDADRQHEDQLLQLESQRYASFPCEQYIAQVQEERERETKSDASDDAHAAIQKRWREQGIWKDEWRHGVYGLWKHEESLPVESESETDSDAYIPVFQFEGAKPRRPKSDAEKSRIAKRRLSQLAQREASRPIHQFLYELLIAQKAEWKPLDAEGATTVDHDICTRAYETVRTTWIKRRIWNKQWGILPGMTWKHEHPVDEQSINESILGGSKLELQGRPHWPSSSHRTKTPLTPRNIDQAVRKETPWMNPNLFNQSEIADARRAERERDVSVKLEAKSQSSTNCASTSPTWKESGPLRRSARVVKRRVDGTQASVG